MKKSTNDTIENLTSSDEEKAILAVDDKRDLANNLNQFSLKESIYDVYNTLLFKSNSKGLEASFYLDPAIDFEVIGDELKFKKIIDTLISNAVYLSYDGYISLRTKLVSINNSVVKIEFRIKGSSINIKDSFKNEILKGSIQDSLSLGKNNSGEVINLADLKKIAISMGGDIWFESEVSQGSTFCFVCEFTSLQENLEITNENLDVKNAKHAITILSVDDNMINQEFMESIIENKGYNFIPAYDGMEALEILKNSKIDIILMDLQLPGMNGYQVTKTIREQYEHHIPIIAITAYSLFEDRNKCIQAGMDNYISKPFNIEELYYIIDSYLLNEKHL